MATGIDFGKQVGPLPLGAWVAVVGAGLGIAWYARRNADIEPEIVESGNGESGVGVGGSGMYTQLTPVVQPNAAPTTNEQWGVNAINWLIAMNYPPTLADSAVRKYLAGSPLSVQETALIGLVLVAKGSPPQVLPPVEGQDPPTTPPVTPPASNNLGKPVGLRQVGKSQTHITVSWLPVIGAEAYRIYGADGGVRNATNGAVTSISVGGLSRNTTYGYYVTAVKLNPPSEGPKSDVIMVRTAS